MASLRRFRKEPVDAEVERVLMATAKAICDDGDTAVALSGLAGLEARHGTDAIVAVLRRRLVLVARALEKESGLPRHLALTSIPLLKLDTDMGLWVLSVMLEREVGAPPKGGALSATDVMGGVYLMGLMVLAADEDRRPF